MSSSSVPPPRPPRRSQIGVPEEESVPAGPKRAEVERQRVPAAPRPPDEPSDSRTRTTAMAPSGPQPSVARPSSPVRSSGVKVDLRQKSKERGRAQRRLILHRVLVFLLAVGGAVAIVWVIFFSPLFALKADRTVVEGAQSSEVDQAVVDTVVIPIVQQYQGTPLTRLSTGKVRDGLTGSPSVLEAEVSRNWPRGLKVTLRQRVPVAMVVQEGGYSLVGSDGAQVSSSVEPVEGLPQITVSATEGDKVQEQASAGVEVWESLPPPLREQVSSISVSGSIVTVDLTSGAKVIWGSAEDSELKAQVLELLVEQAPATTYDLRDPRSPVTS